MRLVRGLALAASLLTPALALASEGHGASLGASLPLWSCIPFAGILLSIALFPLLAPHFWHHHFPKVAMGWALLFGVPFLMAYRGQAVDAIAHIYVADYIPFIILLWALFTVAGGIVVRGSLRGSPVVNTAILAIGTVLASLVGTTGAAMLLVRPLLRANAWRVHKTHLVVFFIFLVANIGGSLTPLGDPPLFLGFLHGVPFFWTLHLFPMYALASVILLALFFVIDRRTLAREPADRAALAAGEGPAIPLHLAGTHNFGLLGAIIGLVLFSGMVHLGEVAVSAHLHVPIANLIRDVGLVAVGLTALRMTPQALRDENGFNWGPIAEVGYLFAGIFMTIIPCLEILKAGHDGALGWLVASVDSDVRYFWVTGVLSSFLDNAPTYLTFFNTALGGLGGHGTEAEQVAYWISQTDGPLTVKTLEAISAGAVFMGANTYIGNAPNFMVKAIAEESGVPMPSFFGYILRWSLPMLIPTFVIVTLVFFW